VVSSGGAGVKSGGDEYKLLLCAMLRMSQYSIASYEFSRRMTGPIADAQSFTKTLRAACAGRHGCPPVLRWTLERIRDGALKVSPGHLDLEGSALSFSGRLQGAERFLLLGGGWRFSRRRATPTL